MSKWMFASLTAAWASNSSFVAAVLQLELDDGINALGAGVDLNVDDMLVVVDGVCNLCLGTLQAALDGLLILGAAAAQTALELLHIRGQHERWSLHRGTSFLMLPAPSTR